MTTATRCKLHLSLDAPDITPMIGAGMGGLAMTLRQLDLKYPSPESRLGNLSWWVTDSSISLDWQGEDFEVLDWLLKQSFQIDDKGLISLTGLNSTAIELSHRIHLHQAIKATFLRLNKFYKVEEEATESMTINGLKGTLKYKKLEWYAHQTFARQLCEESRQLLRDYLQIVSWLHLGATVRHARLDKYNKLEEKPAYAFALLFVPVICQYFILHSNSKKSDNKQLIKYVVVILRVTNLKDAAHRRENLNSLDYTDFYVASLGEAALKYYSFDRVKDIHYQENCQVLVYEKLNKKSQQRTLFQSQDVEINVRNTILYQLAYQQLQKNRVFINREGFIVRVNPVRGIIADKLVQGMPWWSDFWEVFIQRDLFGDLAKELFYNRRGLKAMIDHDGEMEVYQAFIEAFHEALRNIYAKIYSRTQEGDTPRVEREYERIRGEISRCYDDQSYRDFISEFLARAGLNKALYSQWKPILPLIMESVSWQKGRNLALLALASYEPKKKHPSDTEQNTIQETESTPSA